MGADGAVFLFEFWARKLEPISRIFGDKNNKCSSFYKALNFEANKINLGQIKIYIFRKTRIFPKREDI